MIWRGVSRTEWLCAALVTTVSVASTVVLEWYAASVDEITDGRQARLEQMAELSVMMPVPRLETTGRQVTR